jgi:small subunit ribosomal protein S4
VYGVLERQFRTYMQKAGRMPGVSGLNLMQFLERRLDNVVYRLGFSDSRQQARQWVGHGHLQVNGRRVSIPSFLVKEGDVVTWREESKKSEMFKTVSESLRKRRVPGWLTVDESQVKGTIVTLPDEQELDASIDTRLIVEFYSRR